MHDSTDALIEALPVRLHHADMAAPFGRAEPGWTVLRNVRLAPGMQVDIVALQPGSGIAVLELEPRWTEDAKQTLRGTLDAAGFAERFPGLLPIIHRRLPPDLVPMIEALLQDSFAWQPLPTIPEERDWVGFACSVLATLPPDPATEILAADADAELTGPVEAVPGTKADHSPQSPAFSGPAGETALAVSVQEPVAVSPWTDAGPADPGRGESAQAQLHAAGSAMPVPLLTSRSLAALAVSPRRNRRGQVGALVAGAAGMIGLGVMIASGGNTRLGETSLRMAMQPSVSPATPAAEGGTPGPIFDAALPEASAPRDGDAIPEVAAARAIGSTSPHQAASLREAAIVPVPDRAGAVLTKDGPVVAAAPTQQASAAPVAAMEGIAAAAAATGGTMSPQAAAAGGQREAATSRHAVAGTPASAVPVDSPTSRAAVPDAGPKPTPAAEKQAGKASAVPASEPAQTEAPAGSVMPKRAKLPSVLGSIGGRQGGL